MKKTAVTALLGGALVGALALAPTASAAPTWVEDESASICNSLSLASEVDGDWINIQIQSLQLSHDASRSEAVAGIRAAAQGYCPQYLTAVPAR
jgi:hypothetical protein